MLFFSTVYPSPRAPTRGIYNQSLVEALAVDHDVRVIAPLPWTLPRQHMSGTPRPDVDARVATLRPRYYYLPGALRNQLGWFLWLSSRAAVKRLLRTFRPDAVVSYWTHPDGEAAAHAARSAGAPIALIVGGSDVLVLPKDVARRRVILNVLDSVDAVLAVGSDLRERLTEMGVPKAKVHVFRRGVSEGFKPGDRAIARLALGVPADRKILLWVGNLVPVKAVDVLLDAAATLTREDGLEVCLVGDGPLRGRLEARVAGSPLEGRVRFAGAVAQDQLPTWYQAADLTVLPSLSEGTPNVLIESLACGTPFVASRVGGIPALSRHPEDELVPAGDPVALARQLRKRLAQPLTVAEAPPPSFRWRDSAAMVVDVVRSLPTRPAS